MKKLTISFSRIRLVYLSVFMLSVLTQTVPAANPPVSNHWKNLTGETNLQSEDELKPEIVISGNIIHTVWIEYKYGQTLNFWYRRSPDLGKTWDEPKKIGESFEKVNSLMLKNPFVRNLTVSGNTVHIVYSDFEWTANGAGKLYYIRSVDGGQTFETVKVISQTAVGGYVKMGSCIIRSEGGKVAIAYEKQRWIDGNNRNYGIHVIKSDDNGATFKDTVVVDAVKNESLCDFHYDGNQMIVLHQYAYYYYGFNVGKVYVTVSNDNGASFIDHKISEEFIDGTTTREKSNIMAQDGGFYDYRSHIYKSGSSIHIVFDDNIKTNFLTKYIRSTDNGVTFEKPVTFEDTKATDWTRPVIAGKNGKIYIALKKGGIIHTKVSADNGATFTEAKDHFPESFNFSAGASYIYYLLPDPNDESGSTIHLIGNNHFLATSTDGGVSFEKMITHSNCFNNILLNTDICIDNQGTKHWLIRHKPNGGTDIDVYYRSTGKEPPPSDVNKALNLSEIKGPNTIALAVGNAPSLNPDSAITIEIWVKFDPAKTSSAPIVWKLKTSYYDYAPTGYHIAYRASNNLVGINMGLQTDKGQFVNWCPQNMADTLWHHVAFTYNAKKGADNFISYVDGIPVAKQTVTGKIDAGKGLIHIDPNIYSNQYYDLAYQIDELRLWDKALDKKQLQTNMTRKEFSNEENLKLYLNFDDTFKDISGNGNDAVPMLMANQKLSDFDPPLTAFDAYKVKNEVSLNNKTQNGISYNWSFGDKSVSVLQNPKYKYTKPGEYEITLLASNKNSVGSAQQTVSIEGIDRIQPVAAGNHGFSTLEVYGGGLATQNTSFFLRKTGAANLEGSNLKSTSAGVLSAMFNLTDAQLGKWDVVVKTGSAEQVLPQAFEVTAAEAPDVWSTFSGRSAVLKNRWTTFTLTCGNSSNADAYAVPVWFAITETPSLEVEFINFRMNPPAYAYEKGYAQSLKNIGEYVLVESVHGQPHKARLYALMIPAVRAKSTVELKIRLKSGESYRVQTWNNNAWVDMIADAGVSPAPGANPMLAPGISTGSPNPNFDAAACMVGILGEGVIDIGTSAIPGVGCVWSVGKLVYQTGDQYVEDKLSIWNTLWNSAVTFVDCGVNISGIGGLVKGAGVFLANMKGYADAMKECNEILKGKSENEKGVGALSSLDPNEMVGPTGFDNVNWIPPLSEMPYTVLFENKSTATAPAHDVFITDTLDLNKFDIANFGFSSFGWGDTIFTQTELKMKEFSRDIDLRPSKPLIVRVSGKLDTITGVVKFEFKSLNPVTLAEEEDPLNGFLPPNGTNHEGEGFVSYTVGLKKNLSTGTTVKNKASIVFDANDPILTNEYVNTIDINLPVSQVNKVEKVGTDSLKLSWTSTDVGSGVRSFVVYAKKDDGEVHPVLINTTSTSGIIKAETGATYKFYSLATDNAGWKENKTGTFDIEYVNTKVKNVVSDKHLFSIYPNPANDVLNIRLKEAPYVGEYIIEIFGMSGSRYTIGSYSTNQMREGISLPVNALPGGQYLLRVIYGNNSLSEKVTIQ